MPYRLINQLCKSQRIRQVETEYRQFKDPVPILTYVAFFEIFNFT